MRGFPGVVATQHGLPYADLWLWIIRTCNLLVLDSFAYKLSLPTRCKRKLGKKNPFDDVTRRPILELLCWQRIMRAGLTSVIVCSAIVNTPAKWRKPGHKYSRQLRLKLSFPHIYLCQQMRGCNFKCCHTGDLSPDTRNVFSSLLQQGHIFSRLPDFHMFLWLDVFFFCFFFLRQAWNQTSWMRGFAKTSGNTRGGKSHRGQQFFCCSQGRRTTW